MEFSGYLCLKKTKPYKLVGRLTTLAPSLASKEVAIAIRIRVPESLFQTPQLRADITIPESSVTPPVLDAQVIDNVREELQKATGMEIRMSVVEPTAVRE